MSSRFNQDWRIRIKDRVDELENVTTMFERLVTDNKGSTFWSTDRDYATPETRNNILKFLETLQVELEQSGETDGPITMLSKVEGLFDVNALIYDPKVPVDWPHLGVSARAQKYYHTIIEVLILKCRSLKYAADLLADQMAVGSEHARDQEEVGNAIVGVFGKMPSGADPPKKINVRHPDLPEGSISEYYMAKLRESYEYLVRIYNVVEELGEALTLFNQVYDGMTLEEILAGEAEEDDDDDDSDEDDYDSDE